MKSTLGILLVSLTAAACGSPTLGGGPDASSPADAASDVTPGTDAPAADGGCMNAHPVNGLLRLATGVAGQSLALALDDHDDPAVAYLDGTTLRFARWERCTATWTAPVTVATVAANDVSFRERNVALAFEAASGRFGVAFLSGAASPTETPANFLSLSTDGGATWSAAQQVSAAGRRTFAPALAFAQGKPWMAWSEQSDSMNVLAIYDGATVSQVPLAVGARGESPSIAVDAAGNVGVAFWGIEGDYNSQVYFTRPGGTPVRVLDSNNVQNDYVTLALAFDGADPRIAVLLRRIAGGDVVPELYFARGTVGGQTWGTPLRIGDDGDDRLSNYISLGVRAGAADIAVSRGSGGGGSCGPTKLYATTNETAFTCRAIPTMDVAASATSLQLDTTGRVHVALRLGTDTATDGLYYFVGPR